MRAGEAWWLGRDELFSTLADKLEPQSLNTHWVSAQALKTGRFREGVGYDARAFERMKPQLVQRRVWKEAVMIELASEEAAQRAAQAVDRLEERLTTFRSKVGNDLSSMKAASQRVQTEVQSMADKYGFARDLLTSPEFERAIENAERMATALESISRLSETKLSVAVFSGGKS